MSLLKGSPLKAAHGGKICSEQKNAARASFAGDSSPQPAVPAARSAPKIDSPAQEVISVPELMERIKISNTDHSKEQVSQDTLSRVAMHAIQEHEKRVRQLNKSIMMVPASGSRRNFASMDELDELRGSMHLLLAALRSFEMVLDLPPSAKPDHVEAALHSLDAPRNLGVLMELLREMDDVTKDNKKLSMSEVSTLQGIMGTLQRERQESIDRAAGTLQEPGTRQALAHLHEWTKTPAVRSGTPLGEATAALAGPELLWERSAAVLSLAGWGVELGDLQAAKKSQATLLGLSPVQCEVMHALEAEVRALTFQIELLRPLFGPVAEEFGATLAAFQGQLEVLSRLRDIHMLADRLEPHAKQLKGSLKALATMHDRTWDAWLEIRAATYSLDGHSALLEPLRWRGSSSGKGGGGGGSVELAVISDGAVEAVGARSDDDALAAAAATKAARSAEKAEAQAREDMLALEREMQRAQEMHVQREEEVTSLRAELEQRRAEEAAHAQSLEATAGELAEARALVDAKQAALGDLESRLKERDEEIASLEKAKKRAKKAGSEGTARAQEMRKALKSRSKKLKTLRLKLKDAKEADEKGGSKATAKELDRVRAEIGILMQQTNQLEDERDVSDTAWATVKELRKKNQELKKQLEFDPADVRALRDELVELQDERDRADAAWARIKELKAKNRELERAAKRTHAATDPKSKALPFGLPFPGSTRSEVEALKSRIHELEAQGDLSAEMQDEAAALRAQLASVEIERDQAIRERADAMKKADLGSRAANVKVSVLGNVAGSQAVRDMRAQLAAAHAAAEASSLRAEQIDADRQEATAELGKARVVMTDMTAEMDKLRGTVAERDAEVERLMALLAAREEEFEELASQLIMVSDHRDELDRRLHAEQRDRNVLQGERDAMASQLEEASRRLENSASENQRLRGLLAGSEGEIARISMHLESSEAEVARLTLLLESADGDAAKVTEHLLAAETEAARMRELAESTEAEVTRLAGLLAAAEARARKLSERAAGSDGEVERMGELLVSSEAEVDRLKEKLEQALSSLDESESESDDTRQLRELLDGSESMVTQLRMQLDVSARTAAERQLEIERLRAESAERQLEAERLRAENAGAAAGVDARLAALQQELDASRRREAALAAADRAGSAEAHFTLDGYINLRAYMIFRAERPGTDSSKEQQVADWKRAEAEVRADQLAGATTADLAADYKRRCAELLAAGDKILMDMDFARHFAAKALLPADAGTRPQSSVLSHPINLI